MPEYGIDPGNSEYLTPYPDVSDEQKIVAFDEILTYLRETAAKAEDDLDLAYVALVITEYYAEILGA